MAPGRRRLVVVLPQLGDFDSLEYAQALAAALPRLQAASIGLLAIGIGAEAGAERFCAYTGLPRGSLDVDAEPELHRALELYEGVAHPAGPWPSLLLMCAGVGSPGTLAEVLRGYTGDRNAPQRYVPRDDFLCQRGGTFLLEADDSLLYHHRDRGILGFSATMAKPLSFLDPYLATAQPAEHSAATPPA
jgi:hypothetical protein